MGRRTVAAVLAAVLLVGVLAAPAGATKRWYTCTIQRVGPVRGTMRVKLDDTAAPPAFTGKWFRFQYENRREMLAVALAAMATGMRVEAYADLEQATPVITGFLLVQ